MKQKAPRRGRPPQFVLPTFLKLQIEQRMLRELDTVAVRKRQTRSQVIRDLIGKMLDKENNR